MPDPKTNAKITPPDLTRAIPRPRLVDQVAAAAARVVLITGQAAQGKSTVAAQFARHFGSQTAWLYLEPSDGDPARFVHLLQAALQAALPALDTDACLKRPSIARGPHSTAARLAETGEMILAAVAAHPQVCIVLDGLEAIAASTDAMAVVQRMIDALAPPSCLVIVSREAPPLKLEALRVHQELHALTNDVLAFTADEIERFYADLYRMPLTAAQVERIRRISDGWAGGLVLVWEALRQIPEDQREKVIEHALPDALKGDRLAYFSEAVFSRLETSEKDLLVKSSIFDSLVPDLIDSYLNAGTPGHARVFLADMARRNLFIQPFFDETSGWGYRFNQLFRDFLLDKFHRTLSSQTKQRLFEKAADLSWSVGDIEGAIGFFLRAKSFEKAAAGIKKRAMGLSAKGRFADLAAWIAQLPPAIIDDDTWLFYYRTLGERIHGGRKTIDAFAAAHRRFRDEGDTRGQLMALGSLIETAVFTGHPASDLAGWLKTARSLLEQESGNPFYAFAKAVLWMQVAFGYIAVTGDLQQGLSASRNARLLVGSLNNDTLAVNAAIVHGFGLTLSGEFARAEQALTDIVQLATAAYPEYRCLRDIIRMEIALARGAGDAAAALCEASRAEIERFGLLFLYPIHLDLTGRLQIHQQQFEKAAQTASHLTDVAILSANRFYEGLACRLQALRAYRQGHYNRSRQWCRKAIEAITARLGESIHLYQCYLIMGLAACHAGDVEAAAHALEAADTFFDRAASQLLWVETRLARSLLASRTGDHAAAAKFRHEALAMAADKGYATFSIISAGDASPTAEAAATPVSRKATESGSTGSDRPDVTHHPATIPADPSAGTEAGDAVDRLDIRTLGGFAVHRANGKTITDAQWAGQRQRILLKAIIVNGCREIPREVLIDALWPESAQAVALKRFKITLHRLRRILDPPEPDGHKTSFVLLKDNRISLDMSRCRVDVNEFLIACDRIRHSRHHDEDGLLLDACRRAVDIYRGDFLPEEPYLSWAEMKRIALRDQYVAVCMEMAGLLEQAGDLAAADESCALAIDADPLAEQAYQQRMRLYRRQGRRNAAIKCYQRLCRALATELDTTPDPATTALFQAITTSG